MGEIGERDRERAGEGVHEKWGTLISGNHFRFENKLTTGRACSLTGSSIAGVAEISVFCFFLV